MPRFLNRNRCKLRSLVTLENQKQYSEFCGTAVTCSRPQVSVVRIPERVTLVQKVNCYSVTREKEPLKNRVDQSPRSADPEW